jgi:hypothetical protein
MIARLVLLLACMGSAAATAAAGVLPFLNQVSGIDGAAGTPGTPSIWCAAADQVFGGDMGGCAQREVATAYVRGLLAAREAYRAGGSPESLAPVKEAAAELEAWATAPGPAAIARAVLLAAAAAAQSERDEMFLLVEHAVSLEALQLAANEPGAPVVAAHEVAGDLWLQVHRYEEARRAYQRAAARLGATPRVTLGLARVSARLQDERTACAEYRALSEWWGARLPEPPEVAEARTYLRENRCRPNA